MPRRLKPRYFELKVVKIKGLLAKIFSPKTEETTVVHALGDAFSVTANTFRIDLDERDAGEDLARGSWAFLPGSILARLF